MAEPRHLRVVDDRTGEILDACPTCDEWARKHHGVLSQLGQMRAAIDGDTTHDLFPAVKRLHDFWRERCKHPRTEFGAEEFKQARPRLEKYGEEMCRRAIEGAAYDCYTTVRKNGTVKRHDEWELVFRKGKFEEFCNRAPHHLPEPRHVETLAKAILFLYPGMETHEAVAEAQRRLR